MDAHGTLSIDQTLPQGWNWLPVIGEEAMALLEGVPEGGRDLVVNDAVRVLAGGMSPGSPVGVSTGLVVGYVQSGKTLSFETAIALARDNGFGLVIVVAGTSNLLLDQSTRRLENDLGLTDRGRPRRWIRFINPVDADHAALQGAVSGWANPETPEPLRRTVLVTVLKHHGHLANLAALMRRTNLQGIPALVIDDEADQASLNTEVSQGELSATYSRLLELREALPLHQYLQYTATPQAPLLISLADSLSPDYVRVLTPGEEYVGGKDFFADGSRLVRVVRSADVPGRDNPLSFPPASLREALAVFIVGVAVGLRSDGGVNNRSMLVHPSQLQSWHDAYENWVSSVLGEWARIMSLGADEPDRQDLMGQLTVAHADLSRTVDDLPVLAELVPYLKAALGEVRVLKVNSSSGQTPEVDWSNAYAWVLVGGQAMDRGFTVEGLTVTYMPRGIGVGNADTIQQRARFLGYKRRYLGFCRVYLEDAAFCAFSNYVEHEEDIRRQLSHLQDSDAPLAHWKRAFLLDRDLRPCRESVVKYGLLRGSISDAWLVPRVVLSAESLLEANRMVVRSFSSGLSFAPAEGSAARTPSQSHIVCRSVPLSDLMRHLLVPLHTPGVTDSARMSGLLLQLSAVLEGADPVCTVYWMSPTEVRRRSVNDDGEVSNLFQGEYPVEPVRDRGTVYPGDRAIKDPDTVTVQIHWLTLTETEGSHVLATNVPVIAVWIPASFARGWAVQVSRNE